VVLHAVIPVLVYPKGDPSKGVLTYAFMDNGSSGCFITDSLAKSLNVPSSQLQLQLHGESVVESEDSGL
jgi:hypothetical protein